MAGCHDSGAWRWTGSISGRCSLWIVECLAYHKIQSHYYIVLLFQFVTSGQQVALYVRRYLKITNQSITIFINY